MAFTEIASTEIEAGKPLTTTVAGKIKDNFDDHEERIQVIESGTAVVYPPLTFRVNGYYSFDGAQNSVTETTVNFPMLITGLRLLIDTAGSSGTTQIDIKRKRAGGAWTSILTTLPSVASSAGNDALSTNGVVNPTYENLLAGDILRLDITSVQTSGKGLTVRIDYAGA